MLYVQEVLMYFWNFNRHVKIKNIYILGGFKCKEAIYHNSNDLVLCGTTMLCAEVGE